MLYQEECNKELQQHQSPYLKLLALQLFRDLYFLIFTKVSNNAYNKLYQLSGIRASTLSSNMFIFLP